MLANVRKLSFYRDPEVIFQNFHQEPMAIFLDSSLENDLGQYFIIGLHPYLILKDVNGVCTANGICQEQDLLTLLQKQLTAIKEENPYDLPLLSGAIGYFSYDYGRKFEQIHSRHPRRSEIPEALFCFYDLFILADLKKKELYLSAQGKLENADFALRKITQELESLPFASISFSFAPVKRANFGADFTQEEYSQAIEGMRFYMKDGHIYVANMTQQLQVKSSKTPYDTFQYLRHYNPSPFGAYFNGTDFQIVCASPERFLQMKQDIISTRPIKGTRKRGSTPKEDIAMRLELENSEKDRSELLMIMDLERNDLNRICLPGSVKVTEPFVIETYATVFHLVSEITGEIHPSLTAVDLIRSTFPGGSITGAPKIRAMEIIDELEHHRRELYTGSIGYFSADGNCDFNIVIRTAVYEHGIYTLGVGGGITYESDVEFEYEETLQKAKAVLEAINDDYEIG